VKKRFVVTSKVFIANKYSFVLVAEAVFCFNLDGTAL
jgi:hypothetical protein